MKAANTDHQSEVGAWSALAIVDIAAGPDFGRSGLAAAAWRLMPKSSDGTA
jgi:hypothetical protein